MSEKFRPANGTEGDYFQAQFCERCIHDDYNIGGKGCLILAQTMAFNVKDERYPVEWIYGDDGEPTCTKFQAYPLHIQKAGAGE